MLKNDYIGQDCSIARALEAVGERWTLLIVRELLRRPRRFSELQKLTGAAKNILANRLEKMAELGIAEGVAVAGARDWSQYRLTEKGRDLFPVVSALMAWGDRHAAPNGPPVVLGHSCGQAPGHKLVCEGCGNALHLDDLHFLKPPPSLI